MNCGRKFHVVLLSFLTAAALSCGDGGSSSGPPKNVLSIAVNGGPDNNYANGLFATVTLCAPGTSNCQSVPNVLVDTGSFGLRLLSSSLGTLSGSLPQQKGANGDPVFECAQFVDSVLWGPVTTADVSLAGATAKSVPVELVDDSKVPVPSACKAIGPAEEDVSSLGANGILGVGFFITDCGDACTTTTSSNAGFYYSCSGSSCSVAAQPLAQQVQNPVALLPNNNNGIVIDLPAVSASAVSVGGSLVFGIGTSSNNGVGTAQVFIPDQFGNMQTTFKGQQYSGFLDTGSNAYFFLNTSTSGLPDCPGAENGFYCPSSTVSLFATNSAQGRGNSTVNFTVSNASQLFSNSNSFVFPSLAGPNPATFDWGLPFFFGRKVFVAIEGRQTTAGAGPYWAY